MRYKLLFISLANILFFSGNIHSQTIENLEDIPENLTQEIESELLKESSKNNQEIIIEDNLAKINEKTEPNEIFGFDFFDLKPITKSPVLDIPLFSGYQLSYGDELELLLFGNENKLINLRVDLSGEVLIPEVGTVSLLNLSIEEAEQKVRALLSKNFIGTSSSLAVKKPSSRKVNIIGLVKEPGTYIVNPFITLIEALKYAGGLEDNASLRNIKIVNQNGEHRNIDLYDFLIDGNPLSNINLRNGDTVVVESTTNFVEVKGEVIRPYIYEYKNTDKYDDLINFAKGFKRNANTENLFADILLNQTIVSRNFSLDTFVDNDAIVSVYVGKNAFKNQAGIKVKGTGVKEQTFEKKSYKSVVDLIEILDFSDDLYPFYFELTQNDKLGKKEIFSLSIADQDSYKDIQIKENVTLRFFSINEILSNQDSLNLNLDLSEGINRPYEYSDFFEEKIQDFARILLTPDLLKTIYLNNERYLLPIVHTFSPIEIVSILGNYVAFDYSSASIQTKAGSRLISSQTLINSADVFQISYLVEQSPKITVSISGEVKRPGQYVVSSGSTLQDLYDLAGGEKEGAHEKGIIFSRESIKEKERNSILTARKLILDQFISSSNNATSSSAQNSDLEFIIPLIDEASNSNFIGRLVGDIQPGGENAASLVLEEGDSITVPPIPNYVGIAGEVKNNATINYKGSYDINDYIGMSGGYTDYANKSDVYVISSNGLTKTGRNIIIEPGDTIIVPRDMDKLQTLPYILTATSILSNLAFSAASINAVRN